MCWYMKPTQKSNSFRNTFNFSAFFSNVFFALAGFTAALCNRAKNITTIVAMIMTAINIDIYQNQYRIGMYLSSSVSEEVVSLHPYLFPLWKHFLEDTSCWVEPYRQLAESKQLLQLEDRFFMFWADSTVSLTVYTSDLGTPPPPRCSVFQLLVTWTTTR